MTNIVVAYDQQRAIGANDDMPWGRGLPGDLANFRSLTTDTSVIMGRKTYFSIPPSLRPLSGRENIILTHDPLIQIEGVVCVNSLAEAIKRASKEVFVIGGSQVYNEAVAVSNRVYATEIHETFPNPDTFFPELSDEWEETGRVHRMRSGNKKGDQFDYDFVIYDRRT